MSSSAIIVLVLVAALVFWLVGAYNRLVRLRGTIARSFVPVHTQLLQRQTLLLELIAALEPLLTNAGPRLDALRAACGLSAAACARAKLRPGAAAAIASLRSAEDRLGEARAHLPVQSAPGTELAALNAQLAAADSTLDFARTLFNAAVTDYNDAVRQFPTVLIVSLFDFRSAGTF